MKDIKLIKILFFTLSILSLIFSIAHYGFNIIPTSKIELGHDIVTTILFSITLLVDKIEKNSLL